MLSGRGLCDELITRLITRPEESYRLWCVVVYDLETTKILVNEEEAKAHWGLSRQEKKNGGILVLYIYISRLASNEIFSPSNKIHRDVGRAKDLSAPVYKNTNSMNHSPSL